MKDGKKDVHAWLKGKGSYSGCLVGKCDWPGTCMVARSRTGMEAGGQTWNIYLSQRKQTSLVNLGGH